ncbi:MAG: GNAT family N-acetyltransferase [Clostridia bacterium]|nr:GNAT family N-acetyltransferase [Clostridia bacterium]MBR7136672.1 GNAT family N-acetyltransferase [Clostridia bacterium]
MNPYKCCPTYANDRYLLRLVEPDDAADLLKVYSDELAVPIFNCDNCYGDNFHYQTLSRMREAIDFWLREYAEGKYVRWSIVDRASDEAIGTIELFNRSADDFFDNCGILRLDLRSDHEQNESITAILTLILPEAFSLFDCNMIATKCVPLAAVRRNALMRLGFIPTDEALIGHDGTRYQGYLVFDQSAR